MAGSPAQDTNGAFPVSVSLFFPDQFESYAHLKERVLTIEAAALTIERAMRGFEPQLPDIPNSVDAGRSSPAPSVSTQYEEDRVRHTFHSDILSAYYAWKPLLRQMEVAAQELKVASDRYHDAEAAFNEAVEAIDVKDEPGLAPSKHTHSSRPSNHSDGSDSLNTPIIAVTMAEDEDRDNKESLRAFPPTSRITHPEAFARYKAMSLKLRAVERMAQRMEDAAALLEEKKDAFRVVAMSVDVAGRASSPTPGMMPRSMANGHAIQSKTGSSANGGGTLPRTGSPMSKHSLDISLHPRLPLTQTTSTPNLGSGPVSSPGHRPFPAYGPMPGPIRDTSSANLVMRTPTHYTHPQQPMRASTPAPPPPPASDPGSPTPGSGSDSRFRTILHFPTYSGRSKTRKLSEASGRAAAAAAAIQNGTAGQTAAAATFATGRANGSPNGPTSTPASPMSPMSPTSANANGSLVDKSAGVPRSQSLSDLGMASPQPKQQQQPARPSTPRPPGAATGGLLGSPRLWWKSGKRR